MSSDYKTILFTSNLSEISRVAFTHAATMAGRYGAKLVLLHVMESSLGSYEGYVINLFGQEKWQQVLKNNRESAKHALVGKVSPKQMVQTALNQFCKESSTDEQNIKVGDYEIVVKDGDVVDTIISQAKKFEADLIVMGACEGLLSGVSVGKTIKRVLKKAKVPVLVVPGKE
jgi:nucleotide-binding universal stress UspA family protein